MASLLEKSLSDVRRQAPVTFGSGKTRSGGAMPATANHGPATASATDGQWKHDMYNNQADTRADTRRPAPTPPTTAFGSLARSPNLLIENLHYEVSEAELEALFVQIGKIAKGPVIKFDASGRASEGLAFIGYETETHAEDALNAFNGANAKGQPITVKYISQLPVWVKKHLGITDRDPGLLNRIQGVSRFDRRGAAPPSRIAARGGIAPRGALRGASRISDGLTRGAAVTNNTRSAKTGGERKGHELKKDRAALDKELEAFMAEPGKGAGGEADDADVEMS